MNIIAILSFPSLIFVLDPRTRYHFPINMNLSAWSMTVIILKTSCELEAIRPLICTLTVKHVEFELPLVGCSISHLQQSIAMHLSLFVHVSCVIQTLLACLFDISCYYLKFGRLGLRFFFFFGVARGLWHEFIVLIIWS